jgi:methylated-DNA-[protein]-cysteine S-methyltransferase
MLACGELHSDGVSLHVVASDAGIRRIDFGVHTAVQDCRRTPAHPLVAEALRQLRAYLAGELRDFNLPLDMAGTPFQNKVWRALLEIPYGQTRSYAQVARTVGNPKAVRAVGTANGSNPVPIVVPCHRVINTGGKLGGYGGGLPLKRLLLDLESYGRTK